jgi:hypothetical protein
MVCRSTFVNKRVVVLSPFVYADASALSVVIDRVVQTTVDDGPKDDAKLRMCFQGAL